MSFYNTVGVTTKADIPTIDNYLTATTHREINTEKLSAKDRPVERYRWTDAQFKKHFIDVLAKRKCPTFSQSVESAKNLTNVICGLTSAYKHPEEAVIAVIINWQEDHGSIFQDLFAGSDNHPYQSDQKAVVRAPSIKMEWQGQVGITGNVAKVSVRTSYKATQASSEAFYKKMWDLLMSDKMDQQLLGIHVMQLYAAMLMRLVSKNWDDVDDHILDTITAHSNSQFDWDQSIPIPPPHAAAAMMRLPISDRKRDVANGFALLVSASRDTEQKDFARYRPVMMAGCLLTLRFTGMAVIKRTIEAASATGKGRDELLRSIALTKYKNSINTVYRTLATYIKVDDHGVATMEKTWEYARLINPDTLIELTTESHLDLIAMLTFLSRPENEWPDLMSAPSMSKNINNLGQIQAFARIWIGRHMDLTNATAETDETKALLDDLKKATITKVTLPPVKARASRFTTDVTNTPASKAAGTTPNAKPTHSGTATARTFGPGKK